MKSSKIVRMMVWLGIAGVVSPAVGIVGGVVGIPMLFFSVVAGVLALSWSVIWTLVRMFGKT